MLASTDKLSKLRWNLGCQAIVGRVVFVEPQGRNKMKSNEPMVKGLGLETDVLATDRVHVDILYINTQTSGYKKMTVKELVL